MREFSLDYKYTLEEGRIILTGVQALVRAPLDQIRADRRAGLNTAALISGYRGSPLGGLDMVLARQRPLLEAHNVVFLPGVNEDLGATAVFGSQIANLFPNPKYDGVLGMWYGKAPGVDRTGDVFKHANFAGVGRWGGALAVAGDDPLAKSSTLPSHSEVALYDAQMPVLYPGTAQEIIQLARYGFELSRYSGLWVGLKVVTNVADEFSTAEVYPIRDIARPAFDFDGRPWQPSQNITLVAPVSLHLERELVEGRLEAARRFAAANNLNRVVVSTPDDWIGIIAAGKTYYDVREALTQLGLNDRALNRYGIRLFKLGMIYPLEPEGVKDFARGLREIFVIEEKRAFVELFVRDTLYPQIERPRVVGKRDEADRPLVRADSELDADQIAVLLAQRLMQKLPAEVLNLPRPPSPMDDLPLTLERSPYFCSGCPHNRSTVVPEGALAGGGIGCHGMVLGMERNTQGITHMGGEGVQWVGAAPFTHTPHLFQNLGDGTLFHSGTLAIRQAVAAGVNITYKILWNGSVAMTGGQPVDGALSLPALTRALQAEGVRRLIVCSHDPDQYPKDAEWAAGVTIWHRDRLDDAQAILRREPGVSVLIYDQPCAADLRRRRKRGLAPDPPMRVFINEAVCEGCGDCGVKSNCLSVTPVETEFGRKTQIHQPSCNKDYTCLQGDCPAFVTVEPAQKPAARAASWDESVIAELQSLPDPSLPREADIFMVGIGGTGVVTVNQILGTAALLEGRHVRGLDQTGLSQKGGPVRSHLKILAEAREQSNRVGRGAADVYLAFDVLGAARAENLRHASPARTTAVISESRVATGQMVRSTSVAFPSGEALRRSLERATCADRNVYLDAQALAENVFGTHMPANMITVGAAYQAGLLPVSAAAIERAIHLNGESVKTNTLAFRLGRMIVARPDWPPTRELRRPGAQDIVPALSDQARAFVASVAAEGELRRLLEIRVPELIAYQDAAYARAYVDFVKRVRDVEARTVEDSRLSEAVARHLFKLMAYKDEYEVARLYLRPEFRAALTREFGEQARFAYQLHPPLLRALGWKKKIAFGRWFDIGYRVLTWLRFLRGTPFDPFGYAHVRRVERALIGEYRELIERELATLSPATYERAVKIASLPDLVRGYEKIKLDNVAVFRARARELGAHAPNKELA
jgi:indolepyruvate ferredoxin oxidoreductase